jgi:phenylacetate-CoA ligase
MNTNKQYRHIEAKTVAQIKKVIKKWPAYRKFVETQLPDPLQFESLRELPIIDKEFISTAINSLPLFKVRNIIPSSGSTGSEFSFGLFGDDEMRRSSVAIEAFMKDRFRTDSKKTLLLNLLPGAISLQSSSVTVASIGIRSDTAISAIKTLGSSFQQIILAGEPLFMKEVVEYGLAQSIVWQYLPVTIIVGGEWISESYRRYIENIVGPQRLFSSMGMAELGLNYFFETEQTMLLRKMLVKDKRLLKALFGDASFYPMLFSYDERSIVVETVDTPGEYPGSIVLTTADPDRVLPLIRYKSGDKGTVLTWSAINRLLKGLGYGAFDDTGLPVLAHFGRGRHISGIYPERIKEILYSSDEIASVTTGNFFLRRQSGVIDLEVQLRDGVYPEHRIEHLFCGIFQDLPVCVKLQPFERFPYALSFERKVQYVVEGNGGRERGGKKTELQIEVPDNVPGPRLDTCQGLCRT